MATSLAEKIHAILPASIRDTAFIRIFGLLKIPVIFYCRPSVITLDEKKCVIKIPLNRRTKNHLGSMYFGVLAVGADVAGGLLTMREIQQKGNLVNLVFQDFHADFLKRPDGDVYFTCEDGIACRALVEQALQTGERVSTKVVVTATVPSKTGAEPVAKFTLTISLKKRASKA